MMVHLGPDREPWVVRASLMAAGPGPVFLLQLGPAGGAQPGEPRPPALPVEDIIDRLPEGFVVVDHQGVIRRANRAFLDLVQLGAEGSVVGERLGRWLSQPGRQPDRAARQRAAARHACGCSPPRCMASSASTPRSKISAVGNADGKPQYFGVLIRDVSRARPRPARTKAICARR